MRDVRDVREQPRDVRDVRDVREQPRDVRDVRDVRGAQAAAGSRRPQRPTAASFMTQEVLGGPHMDMQQPQQPYSGYGDDPDMSGIYTGEPQFHQPPAHNNYMMGYPPQAGYPQQQQGFDGGGDYPGSFQQVEPPPTRRTRFN